MKTKKHRILVLGRGGREHALIWKILQNPDVGVVYVAPGNPGMAMMARVKCVPELDILNQDAIIRFMVEYEITLVVPGPEDVIATGLADAVRQHNQEHGTEFRVFCPTLGAAALELDKGLAMELCRENEIPTGKFQVFDNPLSALSYALTVFVWDGAVVIKANGLAAGKGVRVCRTEEEVWTAIYDIMVRHLYGDAGKKAVVMEYLKGEEASITVLVDGEHVAYLPSSQDHKARGHKVAPGVYEGDDGPNTGGLGAYAPAPVVTPEIQAEVHKAIVLPIVRAMARAGLTYKGVLYVGIMVTKDGPKVVEINCRFGDPEAQVVLPLLKSDLVELMLACCDGRLNEVEVELHQDRAAVCVVLASEGYPDKYETGRLISDVGIHPQFIHIFHAGTERRWKGRGDYELRTAGGRVLAVTAVHEDIQHSLDWVYDAVDRIQCDNLFYRSDIGHRALARLGVRV